MAIRSKLFLCACGVFALSGSVLYAGETPCDLEKIVITASRIPVSERNQYRSTTTVTGAMIEGSRQTALADIIADAGSIDLRRRSPEGVQADVSIRGVTFEQSQVLLDGTKMNDPQTGHHTMNIPVTKFDMDRVDIMKGHGSSVYGANAFGGVVDLRTRKPAEDRIVVEASGGTFDFFSGGVSLSHVLGDFKNRFSFQEDRSTGYRPETEFTIMTLSEHAYLDTPAGNYDLLFGYARKDFGADSFYSNLFPNEEEHIDVRFFRLGSEIAAADRLTVKPVLFLRRHRDKFALDRNRPGWQTNYHTTYNYGGEIGVVQETDLADVAYGFELSRDTIDSTSLQTHRRTKDGMYVELNPHLPDALLVNIGFREDRYSDFGWEYSPSLSGSCRIFDRCKIRSSIGRAFRVPTFTERYYRDSANVGNSDLNPETAWSYEVGLDYEIKGASLKATVFRRDAENTIDWIRYDTRSLWQARNIGTVHTNGLEVTLEVDLKRHTDDAPFGRVFVDYTALDSYFKHDYLSKYASDYLKHHIAGGVDVRLPCDLKSSWGLHYKKRVGDSGVIVVDTRLSKEIVNSKKVSCEAFLDVTNLFGVRYSEQSDLDMPGRWIKAGARARF